MCLRHFPLHLTLHILIQEPRWGTLIIRVKLHGTPKWNYITILTKKNPILTMCVTPISPENNCLIRFIVRTKLFSCWLFGLITSHMFGQVQTRYESFIGRRPMGLRV